jgi:hypothetical protein
MLLVMVVFVMEFPVFANASFIHIDQCILCIVIVLSIVNFSPRRNVGC